MWFYLPLSLWLVFLLRVDVSFSAGFCVTASDLSSFSRCFGLGIDNVLTETKRHPRKKRAR